MTFIKNFQLYGMSKINDNFHSEIPRIFHTPSYSLKSAILQILS